MPALFGEKLRFLRLHHGLTQQQTADLLGLARHGYISNLETGKKEPSLELVLRAAVVFRTSMDYLLRDDVQPASHLADTHYLGPPYQLDVLGERVLRLRKAAGITQTNLASAVGLTQPGFISNIEKGRKFPSLSTIVRLADLFNIPVDYLFALDEELY
jgi:transcriptional regulator with XRE-family HTH domain